MYDQLHYQNLTFLRKESMNGIEGWIGDYYCRSAALNYQVLATTMMLLLSPVYNIITI